MNHYGMIHIYYITLSYPPQSESILAYEYQTLGNIVLCQDCNMITKIGPINETLKLYYPIKININFNINEIILQGEDTNYINLYTYFMIIHEYIFI